jgi:hypothetical protein
MLPNSVYPAPLIAKNVTNVNEPVAVITVTDMIKMASARTWPGSVTRSPSTKNFVEIECDFKVRAIVTEDDVVRIQTLLKLRGEI